MMTPLRVLAFVLGCSAAMVSSADVVHNYDLKSVLWRVELLPVDRSIVGDVTNTVTLTSASPTVQFHCCDLKVDSASIGGVPTPFSQTSDILTVTLPAGAKAGDTFAVRTQYSGKPECGLYFVPATRAFPAHTPMVYSQGQTEDNRFWLPTYDLPDDKAMTECYITVPATWTALSNGKFMDVQNAGAKKTFHWRMDQPYSTYLISLAAGEFSELKDSWHGIPVSAWVPPGLETEGRVAFSQTKQILDLYSKLTGVDYPYPKFGQVAVSDFMYEGMENITCITQTIQALRAAGTEPFGDTDELVAHETAHQWFGDLVTCQTWEHSWINEGFANALTVLFERAAHGQEAFDWARYQSFEDALNGMGQRDRNAAGPSGSVATVSTGSSGAFGDVRILFLMHKLGEPAFWNGIHAFLEKYKFQCATTDQFFEVVGKAVKQDLRPFEKEWFHSRALPSISISIVGTDLVVDQLQPYYTFDLPVWALENPVQTTLFSTPSWTKKMVKVTGAQVKLPLGDLAHMPILIDPEVWVPMDLSYKMPLSPDQIMQMFQRSPNVAQRARLIASFYSGLPIAQRLILAKAERHSELLKMMISRMGQDSAPFLLAATRHSDRTVMAAAIRQLGTLNKEPKVQARLQEIAQRESNETVRERATQVLLNWAADDKLAQNAWKAKAFDDGFRCLALDWWAKNAPDAARTHALDVLKNPDSEVLRVHAIKILGKVKESGAGHDVYDALLTIAQERSLAARSTAITALGHLGNKAAIQVLQPITARGLHMMRQAAAEAIAELNK